MTSIPMDFSLTYQWVEGSVPPPYHYELLIRLDSAGQGALVLWPDYPAEGVPEWKEHFALSPGKVEGLLREFRMNGLFTLNWRSQLDPPVGGSSEWLTVFVQGQKYEIPAFVIREQADKAETICTAVRALVPGALWDKLESQRQEYIKAFEGK